MEIEAAMKETSARKIEPDQKDSLLASLRIHVDILFYQARMVYSWWHALLFLGSVGVVLTLVQKGRSTAFRNYYDIFEVVFPLVASFFLTDQILREQRQRTLVFIGVTRFSLPYLYLLRVFLILLFLVGTIAVSSLMLHLLPVDQSPAYSLLPGNDIYPLGGWPAQILKDPNGTIAVLLTLFAPLSFLAGLGVFLAHLFADVRVGNLVVFALWMFNRAAGLTLDAHPIFQYIYLFARSEGTNDWFVPKLVQLALGVGFFLLSGLVLTRPERLLHEP